MAYDTANALPSRASRAFSELGCSWIPLWSTPLLRLLVSSPACVRCSNTTTRGGFSGNLCPKLPCDGASNNSSAHDTDIVCFHLAGSFSAKSMAEPTSRSMCMSELTKKYGKILFVFCGGGCKAIMQAVAAAELVKAGLTPSHIISSSAGSCNALGIC